MVNDKGVIISYLCINPSCEYSVNKLIKESVVSMTTTKATFKIEKHCPKCKTDLELLGFVSGSVKITPDYNTK